MTTNPPTQAHITDQLRQWQIDALQAWRLRGRRGVVEAATGTGKTRLAIAAISEAKAADPDCGIAIVVPTLILAEQWRDALVKQLDLDQAAIDEYHSDAPRPTGTARVVLAVINSARDHLPGILTKWHKDGHSTLMIVDECHRAASESNRRVLQVNATWTLGLSATPERDDGDETVVYSGLGEVCYRYPLIQALEDGVLAPVTILNVYVDFTAAEQAAWSDLSATIGTLTDRLRRDHSLSFDERAGAFLRVARQLSRDGDQTAGELLAAIGRRTKIVRSATNRLECLRDVATWQTTASAQLLVFHEVIEDAEACRQMFVDAGIATSLEHSELPATDRKTAVDEFRRGDSRVLVVVKAVDEGVDVPEASCAVIAAGSRSRRQRIQRIGRVLRALPGKQALVVTVLVRGTPEEYGVGLRDVDLLGAVRVRHHRWTAPDDLMSVVSNPALADSYHPGETTLDFADELVRDDLGFNSSDERPAGRAHLVAYTTDMPRNSWITLDEAVARLGAPRQWINRQLPQIRAHTSQRTGTRPAGDVVHAIEFDDLCTRWQREERTPPHGVRQPTVRRTATQTRPATTDTVLAAAERLSGAGVLPTHRALARELQVNENIIDRLLRDETVLKVKIKQLARDSRRN